MRRTPRVDKLTKVSNLFFKRKRKKDKSCILSDGAHIAVTLEASGGRRWMAKQCLRNETKE